MNYQGQHNDFLDAALAMFELDHELARQGYSEAQRGNILQTLLDKTTVPAPSPAVIALRNVHALDSGTVDFKTARDAEEFARLVADKYPPAGYGTTLTVASLQGGGARVRWQVFSAD